MDVAQGTITAPTVNGNTSVVSSTSFTPKVVFFWTTGQTSAAIAASSHAQFCLGAATSSSAQGCAGFCCEHGPTTMNTGKNQRDDSCISLLSDGIPTIDAFATMTTLASNGFTITWTDAPTSAILVHWLALGGTDIVNVKVGKLSIPTSGATFDTTGVGFQPNRLIVFGVNQATASMNTGTVHAQFHIGATDGGTQWTQFMGDPDAVGTSTSVSSFSSAELIRTAGDGGVAIDVQCSFNSWLADGFRLNAANFPAAITNAFYVAFDSPAIVVYHGTKPVTNISKDYFAADPDAVLLASIGAANDDTGASINSSGAGVASIEIGAMTGSAQGMAGAYTDDAAATAICCKRFSTSDVLFLGDPATTATTQGTATRSAITGTALFTLSWTGTTATATRFGWVSFGVNGTPPGNNTVLLDDFNRADGTLGANWAFPITLTRGTCDILTNALRVVTTYTDSYWTAGFPATQAVFFDVVTVSTGVADQDLMLWITGPNTANPSFLKLYYDGSTHLLALQQKLAAGGDGNLPSDKRTDVYTLVVGDRYGLQADAAGNLTAWVKKTAAGTWVKMLAGTTTVPVPTTSFMGISGNTGVRLDNFSGGSTVLRSGQRAIIIPTQAVITAVTF